MTELHGGTVTNADLYSELVGMRGDLSRAVTRLEVINVRNIAADRIDADHESRIRVLEAFRWKLLGVAVCVALASGTISGIIGYVLGHVR
jgi:hypothetical protein